MKRALWSALFALVAASAAAQLPADAVDLGKLNIPEKIKASDLCPVHLTPSDPKLPTWDYKGVTYRGSSPDAKDEFMKDPDKFAAKAAEERWVKNFIAAMSTVWCPVTDEVTPGGLLQWDKDGITWESCCAFCDESVKDEDFPKARERLVARAMKSYQLTGGKYVNDAPSALSGAIDPNAKPAERDADGRPIAPTVAEPAWMKGKTLKPTFNEGIGLVVQNRCVECHRPDGTAPMPFTNFAETKKWSKSLKASVAKREMPPWPADPNVGKFANVASLTQKEVDLFEQWAKAGFPEGEGSFKIEVKPPQGKVAPLEDAMANKDFVLAAGADKTEVKAKFEFKEDGKIVSLCPNLGPRARQVAYQATLPGGKKVDLLRIADWNADYMMPYVLAEPLAAPKGTVVEMTVRYDNSKLNAKNPDPTKEVKSGKPPEGETCEGWIGYATGK